VISRAYDKKLLKDVAVKMEKKDKNRRILVQEYQMLKRMQGS